MPLKVMLKIAAVLAVAACATGCSSLASLVSTEEEIRIGAQAAPEFEKEFGGRVANASLQQYVSKVGQSVARVSERQDVPYEYALLNSDVPNAFALPGGKIYITAGLMSRMENERELAAVLGHETGHVAARHSVKGLQAQMGASVLIELAGMLGKDSAEATQLVAKVVAGMANLKYSRDNEYEADAIGIRYAAAAGYNPWGMVELLDVLLKLSESEGGTLTEMFQTHPLTTKRIAEAQAEVQKNHPAASRTQADPSAARFMSMRSLLKTAVKP